MTSATRAVRLLVPLLLAATLAGCGSSAPQHQKSGNASKGSSQSTSNNLTNGFPLASASLPSYTANYQISGAAQGTMTWTVTQQGQNETLVTIHQQVGSQVEADSIVLTRKGLNFVSAQEDASAPGHHLTISAKLKGKKIVESATVDGKAESVSYPVSGATMVNVSMLAVLAGLNVQPGQLQVAQDVILKHGVAVPIGFTANDRTKLTTPAGTFSVVPVTLSGSGPNQKVYVDTQHHVVVKYLNSQTTITLTKLSQ